MAGAFAVIFGVPDGNVGGGKSHTHHLGAVGGKPPRDTRWFDRDPKGETFFFFEAKWPSQYSLWLIIFGAPPKQNTFERLGNFRPPKIFRQAVFVF